MILLLLVLTRYQCVTDGQTRHLYCALAYAEREKND